MLSLPLAGCGYGQKAPLPLPPHSQKQEAMAPVAQTEDVWTSPTERALPRSTLSLCRDAVAFRVIAPVGHPLGHSPTPPTPSRAHSTSFLGSRRGGWDLGWDMTCPGSLTGHSSGQEDPGATA